MNTNMLTIGADVETFLRDSSYKVRSALEYLPGSKARPCKTQHGAVQPDGVLAEFNVIPANDPYTFSENVRLVLGDLEEIAGGYKLNLLHAASATLADDEFINPLSRVAGCEPDFNAWTGEINPKPDVITNLRCCGGHVHISHPMLLSGKRLNVETAADIIKVMDVLMGVPSVILDHDRARRSLYGKAGAFRPKMPPRSEYTGVEYRVLSNFWINSTQLSEWVFTSVGKGIAEFSYWKEIADHNQERVISIINDGDITAAITFTQEFKLQVGHPYV